VAYRDHVSGRERRPAGGRGLRERPYERRDHV
jgi:hypothetical protein